MTRLIRTFVASTLHLLADEVEPEPRATVPWAFLAVLGAGVACVVLGDKAKRTEARVKNLESQSESLRRDRASLDKLRADVTIINASIDSLEARTSMFRDTFYTWTSPRLGETVSAYVARGGTMKDPNVPLNFIFNPANPSPDHFGVPPIQDVDAVRAMVDAPLTRTSDVSRAEFYREIDAVVRRVASLDALRTEVKDLVTNLYGQCSSDIGTGVGVTRETLGTLAELFRRIADLERATKTGGQP